jgi:hypothetical protein
MRGNSTSTLSNMNAMNTINGVGSGQSGNSTLIGSSQSNRLCSSVDSWTSAHRFNAGTASNGRPGMAWHGMSRLLPRRLEGERIRQVESGYVFILEHYNAANTGC